MTSVPASFRQAILVVGPAWVGDMVMAQTLFKLLQQQGAWAIDVLAPAVTAPLLARMPEVRQAIVLPLGHGQLQLKQRYQLGKQLRQHGYQQAIVLPNSWKSALVPFFARVPQRTGWMRELRYGLLNDWRYLNKAQLPLMIQRFAALGLPAQAALPVPLPWPALVANPENQQQALQRYGLALSANPKILALCPGAEYGVAKRWPPAHFAVVAQQYLQQGGQVWLFGSAKDQASAEAIQSLTAQACVDLTGKTDLGTAIDLLALANVVVSNDSGLMHIAAALKRPVVVLYGSSDPSFTPPLTDQAIKLSLNLPCSPCFQRECPLQHLRCLQALLPEQVLQAIEQLVP